MSKPRHWWWSAVRLSIRQYPLIESRKRDLQEMQTTRAVKSCKGRDGKHHDYSPTGSRGTNARTVERLAMVELPPIEERILNAVRAAIEATEARGDGVERMALIRDYYWARLPMQTAADRAHVDVSTAKRWVGVFARHVAAGLGYLQDDKR